VEFYNEFPDPVVAWVIWPYKKVLKGKLFLKRREIVMVLLKHQKRRKEADGSNCRQL
jgi:hypothetical protein